MKKKHTRLSTMAYTLEKNVIVDDHIHIIIHSVHECISVNEKEGNKPLTKQKCSETCSKLIVYISLLVVLGAVEEFFMHMIEYMIK